MLTPRNYGIFILDDAYVLVKFENQFVAFLRSEINK